MQCGEFGDQYAPLESKLSDTLLRKPTFSGSRQQDYSSCVLYEMRVQRACQLQKFSI